MAGLLDTPADQGLLSAALSMLAASGPSPKRTSVGQVVGLGGLQGMNAYNEAVKQQEVLRMSKVREELLRAQIAETMAEAEQRKSLAAKGINLNKGLPAAVQIGTILSDPNVSEDLKASIRFAIRSDPTIAGIPYNSATWEPRVPVSSVADVKRTLAENEALGTGFGRARTQGLITSAEEDAKAARQFEPVYDPASGRTQLQPRASLPGYPSTRIPQASPSRPDGFPRVTQEQQAERDRIAADVKAGEDAWNARAGTGTPAQPTAPALVPAEQKRDEDRRAKIRSLEGLTDRSQDVVKSLDRAIGSTNYLTAGFGGLTAILPNSPARTFKGEIDTIAANIGFDKLQNMRFESPTGGALGQVAVQELLALQNSIASLDRLRDPNDVKASLAIIKDRYERNIKQLNRAIAAERYYLENGVDIKQNDPLGIR